MSRIVYVASEVYPLIKTGGLGDVAGSLPAALAALGEEVHVVMPAYYGLVKSTQAHARAAISLAVGQAELYETRLADNLPLWLVSSPDYFDNRSGHPYLNAQGQPWLDNAQRFGLFCQAVAHWLGADGAQPIWQADIVHCNDWQTGLIPALVNSLPKQPGVVFTIHNLAYQGLFPHSAFLQLGLPASLWHYSALEFHSQLSFIKGGLVYADRINTVSPTYAREIQDSRFGFGLETLLRHRAERLHGILNGIDEMQWNPATDKWLPATYTVDDLSGKRTCKAALQRRLGLSVDANSPLLGNISRLVAQKGSDLIVNAIPRLVEAGCQIVVLGNGEHSIEKDLITLSAQYPQQVAVDLGFDEGLAHLIEAGSDMFLMPSRFEPCGLNQMYSQRYGSVPIVRPVGGLADTVVPVTAANLASGSATGFVVEAESSAAIVKTVITALEYYKKQGLWQQLQRTGMQRDFSWQARAQEYITLYQHAIADSPTTN